LSSRAVHTADRPIFREIQRIDYQNGNIFLSPLPIPSFPNEYTMKLGRSFQSKLGDRDRAAEEKFFNQKK
jgi:hypothetical protein